MQAVVWCRCGVEGSLVVERRGGCRGETLRLRGTKRRCPSAQGDVCRWGDGQARVTYAGGGKARADGGCARCGTSSRQVVRKTDAHPPDKGVRQFSATAGSWYWQFGGLGTSRVESGLASKAACAT